MDISDGPFNKPSWGKKKNIRFTPTNSWNPILMAHSCGLGGKYWYKQIKVFHTEHLKRLVQGGLEIFFFSFLSDSVKSALDRVRQMLFLYKMTVYFQLDLALILFWPSANQLAFLPLVSWLILLFQPTIGHTCNFREASDAPLRAGYRMHRCMNKYWDVCVCGFKGVVFSEYFHSLPTLLESCNVIKVY